MDNEERGTDQEKRDIFEFEYDEDVDPLELVGNASLSLHHHMAPPEEELEDDSEWWCYIKELSQNGRVILNSIQSLSKNDPACMGDSGSSPKWIDWLLGQSDWPAVIYFSSLIFGNQNGSLYLNTCYFIIVNKTSNIS